MNCFFIATIYIRKAVALARQLFFEAVYVEWVYFCVRSAELIRLIEKGEVSDEKVQPIRTLFFITRHFDTL